MTNLMKQPLTNSRDEEIILYDMNTMVEFNPTMASGYVALLSPLKPQKKEKSNKSNKKSRQKQKEEQEEEEEQQPDSPYMLAFLALIEGNVVDACFGIQTYGSGGGGGDHKCAAFARRAKHLIDEASDTSDAVEQLAVDTYRQAFTIVMKMRETVKKTNVLWRCLVVGRIRKKAATQLRENFVRLEEAIQSST